MKKLEEALQAYAATLPKAHVYYREDWACDYYELNGKCFGRVGGDKAGRINLTVKGQPEENEILREQYDSVIPGYYANKVHWNSVYLDSGDFSKEALQAMIKQSYDLVKGSFSKKIQQAIEAE